MILLTPKKCKGIIGINSKEVSYFELGKGLTLFFGEENPKESISIEIIMKDKTKHNVFYGFDNKESRDKCFSKLKEEDGSRLPMLKTWDIFKEVIQILNATQRL